MESTELQTAPAEHELGVNQKAVVALDHVNDQSLAPFDQFFGGASGESQNRSAARLLRSPSLSHSANGSVRSVVFRRVQQAHGNRLAQRALANRFIQRDCSCGGTCAECRAAAQEATGVTPVNPVTLRLVQPQRNTGGTPVTESSRDEIIPPDSEGKPLEEKAGRFMGERFGTDFSNVRVHTDTRAASAAEALDANAFTTGRDIYFASGKYAPESSEGQRLLAHELTHTIQQGENAVPSETGAKPGDSVIVGSPDHPLEREAEQISAQITTDSEVTAPEASHDQSGTIRGDWRDTARDTAAAAWHATGGRVVGAVKEGAEQIVRRVSPELADLIAQGPMAFVKGLIHTAITQWIPSLPGGSNLIEIAQAVIQGFNKAFALIAGVAKGDAKSCQAFADMLTAVRDAGLKILESPAVQRLKETVSEINHTVAKFLSLVIAPQFEMLSSVLGGAWQFIKAAASKVSGWFKKARSAVGQAWDWVLEKLGFSGPEDENGVWAWIKRKADQIWTGIKETLGPVVGPLKTVGKTLFAFSGLGQIYLLVKYGPKVVEAVQWLWAHRNDPDIIRSAHKEMGQTILPKLLEGVGGFKKTLNAAVNWFTETVTSLSTSVLELLGAITRVPLLSIAKELVRKASELFQKLVTWADSEFQSAVKWVTEVVQKITNFVAPYKEILSSLALAVTNPAMIPPILAGWAWQAVPHCIRAPIINFILDIVIGAMQALPDLPMFGPLWLTLKPGVVAFLRRIRTNATDTEKEQISIKIAKIIRGSSLDFLLGFAKGVLKGVWEGITDPIKAIWMVMEGLTWVMDYLDSLAKAALGGGAKQTAGPPAGAVAATGQARTAPPSLPGALSSAGEMPASKLSMSATTPLAASSSASQTSATTSPVPAASVTAAVNPELGESVKDFASSIRPDVDKVLGNFWSAVEEYFSGGKGVTYEDLLAKFGELWSTIQEKIKEMGGELADKVVKFFTSGAEADDTLGEGIGWLVGTVAFQLLLDFITAGGWAAAGPVVKGIAKFINWPMEFMGEAFKLLGKLGGYIVDGLKSLGKIVKETGGRALKAVTEAMGNIGQKLVSFAEQLLGRFGGAAAREGTQLAEREAVALAEKETAKLAEREAAALTEKETAKLTEKEAGKLAEKEGAEAAEKKAAKEAGEKGEKATIEEAAEQPVAQGLAEGIEVSLEAKGASVGALLGALELLKARFKWVKGFEAQSEATAYMVYMLASRIPLLPYKPSSKLGKAGPVDEVGPSGKKWNDPTMTSDDFLKDYKSRYPGTTLSDEELKEVFTEGKRLNPETGRLRDPNMPLEPTGARPDLPTEGKEFEDWQKFRRDDPSTIPCFPPGTVVKTPYGDRKIETLRPGDSVLSYDFETSRVMKGCLTAVHKNWTVHLAEVEITQGSIRSTLNHPFWVKNEKRWVQADDLSAGMELLTASGTPCLVKSISHDDVDEQTYNLEIADQHVYFVGPQGVLVHNADVTAAASALESGFMSIDTYATAIYQITDTTGKVVYVGQTTLLGGSMEGVQKRLLQHVNDPESALYISATDARRLSPDFPANLFSSQMVSKGNWTAYEAAVWEQYHIDVNGGKSNLLNRQDAITPEKFERYKNLHNPCRRA